MSIPGERKILLFGATGKTGMEDQGKQENLVLNSPNPYHILRPVGLKDGDPDGDLHLQSEGKLLVDSMIENKKGISAICKM